MRFRLRSLFLLITLLAAILAWFAWGVRRVHQREALLSMPGVVFSAADTGEGKSLPLLWALAGAKPVRQILVHPAVSEEILAQLGAAFPEAEIHREASGRGAASER